MNKATKQTYWPYFVWALQLIPAVFLFVVFGPSIRISQISLSLDALPSILGVFGLLWAVAVLLILANKRSRQWLYQWRIVWCLNVAILVFLLLLVDITLTLAGWVPTIASVRAKSMEYSFFKYSGYRMIPKKVPVSGSEPIAINYMGFRGVEIDPVKPSGRKRIVFLGGSQVFDFNGGDWPAKTGQMLRDKGHDVDVVNAGVHGHNTTDTLQKLYTDIWTLNPDVMFLCQAWNDTKYLSRVAPGSPYREPPPAKPITLRPDWRMHPTELDRLMSLSSLYRSIRYRILSELFTEEGRSAWQTKRPELIDKSLLLDGMGLRQYDLNLTLIIELASRINATLILCKQPYVSEGTLVDGTVASDYILRNTGMSSTDFDVAMNSINAIIERVAKKHNITVIDLHKLLSTNSSNFVDSIHYSPLGSDLVAEHIAIAIEKLL